MNTFEYYYYCLVNCESNVIMDQIQTLVVNSFGKSMALSDCVNNEVLLRNFQYITTKFKTEESLRSFIYRERLYYLKIMRHSLAKMFTSTSCPPYIVQFVFSLNIGNISLPTFLTDCFASQDSSILEKCECLQCLIVLLVGNRYDMESSELFDFSLSNQLTLLRQFKHARRLLTTQDVEEFYLKELAESLLDLLLSMITSRYGVIANGLYGDVFCASVNNKFNSHVELINGLCKRAVQIADFCIYQISFIACQKALILISDNGMDNEPELSTYLPEIVKAVSRLMAYHPVELGALVVQMKPEKSTLASALAALVASNDWELLNGILSLPPNPLSNALHNVAKRTTVSINSSIKYMQAVQYDWSLGCYLGLQKWKLLYEQICRSDLSIQDSIKLMNHACSQSSWRLELFSPNVLNYYTNVMCLLVNFFQKNSIDIDWLAHCLRQILLKFHVCLPNAFLVCSMKVLSAENAGDSKTSTIIASVIIEDKLIFDYRLKAVALKVLMDGIFVDDSNEESMGLVEAAEMCAKNILHQINNIEILLPITRWFLARHDSLSLDDLHNIRNILNCDFHNDGIFGSYFITNDDNDRQNDINTIYLMVNVLSILANSKDHFNNDQTILDDVINIFHKYISASANIRIADALLMLFSSMRYYIHLHRHFKSISALGQLAVICGSFHPKLLSECLDLRTYLLSKKIIYDDSQDLSTDEFVGDVVIPERLDCVESALIAVYTESTHGLRLQFPSKSYTVSPLSFLILQFPIDVLLDKLSSSFTDCKCILPRLITSSNIFTEDFNVSRFRYILPTIQSLLFTLDDKEYLNYKCILANMLLQSAGSFFLPVANAFLTNIIATMPTFNEYLCPLMCTLIKLLPFNRFTREQLHLLRMLLCEFNDELLLEQDNFERLETLLEPLIMLSPTLKSICIDPTFDLQEYPVFLKFRDEDSSEFNVVAFERCTGLCLIVFRKCIGNKSNSSLLEKMFGFIICQAIMYLRKQRNVYGFKHFIRAELDRVFTVLSTYIKRKHCKESMSSCKYFESLSILYRFAFQRV